MKIKHFVISLIEEGLVCTFGGWKRKGCSANANVQSVECTVPNVDNIVIATVHQIAAGGTGNFQCNAATYPLADDATYAFTWYKDVIYMSDGCRAVFNVGYDTCVVGESFFFLNSVLRPFQDYFCIYETGQSGEVGRKRENPEKNHLAHPQAELGLSHMWPVRGLNPHQTQRSSD